MFTQEEKYAIEIAEELAGISEYCRLITKQADYIRMLEAKLQMLEQPGKLFLTVDKWDELFGMIAEQLVITFHPTERSITVEGVSDGSSETDGGAEANSESFGGKNVEGDPEGYSITAPGFEGFDF